MEEENAMKRKIEIELLTEDNIDQVRMIQRDDISEAFVDSVDTIYQITEWGITHNCKGHTYAVKYDGAYVGIILLGEALEYLDKVGMHRDFRW